jgi:hypothetical protein
VSPLGEDEDETDESVPVVCAAEKLNPRLLFEASNPILESQYVPLVEGTILTSKSSPSVDDPELGEQLMVPAALKSSHNDISEGEPGFPAQSPTKSIPVTVLPEPVIVERSENF